MTNETRPVPVTSLKKGDMVALDGKTREVVAAYVKIVYADGSKSLVKPGVHLDVVIPEDEELCPNGQNSAECSEIDPCETCWQDQQEEGDEIERSMGLRPDFDE